MRLVSVLLIGAVSISFAGENPVSKYTSTAEKKAIHFQREKSDQGEFEGIYRGFGGYDLQFVGGDERSWINIRFGKSVVDLREPTMDLGVGIGFFPHKANHTVEWRGVQKNGKFVPYALIYRIAGVDENGKHEKTRLVVIKLAKERSRIIGHADEPNAEVEAERIADSARGD